MNDLQVLWAVRRLTLGRGLNRRWTLLRATGGLVTLAYAVPVFGGMLLVGLDLVQHSSLALPTWGLTLLTSLLNFWPLIRRSHPLALHVTDLTLLNLPIPQDSVLRWPLLRALGVPLTIGLGCGVLVFMTTPLGLLALAPALSALASVPLAALVQDAHWRSDRRTQRFAAGLVALPLVGLLHPVGLLPATLLECLLVFHLWRFGWQRPNPKAVRDMEFTGLVHTAATLQIPPPTAHPEAPLYRPHWRPGLETIPAGLESAFRVVAWRSVLHLLSRLWKLTFPILLGAALPLVLPVTIGLDPLTTGALLLLSALLALTLSLGGPDVPAYLPISPPLARLARILPAALVLGGLAGVSALVSALLSGAGVVTVLPALLLPWAALSLGAWVGAEMWMPRSEEAQMKMGLASLPVLVIFLTVHSFPWLTPLALFLLGLPGGATGIRQLTTMHLSLRGSPVQRSPIGPENTGLPDRSAEQS